MKRFLTLIIAGIVCANAAFPANSIEKGRRLRIVTYNVGAFGKTDESDIRTVAGMIEELGADAIALQETDSCTARSGRDTAQVELFCKEMDGSKDTAGWQPFFGKAMPFDGGAYGVGAAIAPHIRVIGTQRLSLPKNDGAEPRACLIIECEDFVFASTHLDHISEAARLMQLETITRHLKARYGDTDMPVFLCGDLNDVPGSATIRALDKDWTRITPEEATEPSEAPAACIDYIAVLRNGADCKIIMSEVHRDFRSGDTATASDHLPVLAEAVTRTH